MSQYIAVVIKEVPYTDLEIGELILVETIHKDFYYCDWQEYELERAPWTLLASDIEVLDNHSS